MEALAPSPEVMSELVTCAAEWIAYGLGLTVVVWVLGYVVEFIINFLR